MGGQFHVQPAGEQVQPVSSTSGTQPNSNEQAAQVSQGTAPKNGSGPRALGGIGCRLDYNRKKELEVLGIVPGGAAAESGILQPGDIIEMANGTRMAGLSMNIAKQYFIGEEGSPVQLSVQRAGYGRFLLVLNRSASLPSVLPPQQPGQAVILEKSLAHTPQIQPAGGYNQAGPPAPHGQQLQRPVFIDSVVVMVVRAARLLSKDFFSGKSDPFVTVVVNGQKKKTETIHKDLNPIWNQQCAFRGVLGKGRDTSIHFIVEDFDLMSNADFLGQCFLRESQLTSEPQRFEMKLQGRRSSKKKNKDRGSLTVVAQGFNSADKAPSIDIKWFALRSG